MTAKPARKLCESNMPLAALEPAQVLDDERRQVLSAERLNAGAVARFQREMRAIGKLQHANIVQALDAGEHDGTELVVGATVVAGHAVEASQTS